jgi:helix-turn-helix protein
MMTSKLLDNYMTEADLAAELDKGVRTLQIWRARRTGPAWTKNGKTILYSREAILAWLKSQEQQPVRQRNRAA